MANKVERENSFALKQPELLKLWDFDKNTLDPYKVSDGSHQKAWFICPKCGKSFFTEIRSLKNLYLLLCPTCRNKYKNKTKPVPLVDFSKNLSKEFDLEKNFPLTPETVTKGYGKKIWWICPEGHSYCMSPNQRTYRSRGCPFCNGQKVIKGKNDLLSQNPTFAKEFLVEKNHILPSEVFEKSSRLFWWKCSNCNNDFQATPNDRSRWKRVRGNAHCPSCNASSGQIKRKNTYIKKYGSLKELFPEIAAEWDYSKNASTPDSFNPFSRNLAWWLCPVCGTSYKKSICSRTNQLTSCPNCTLASSSFAERFMVNLLRVALFPKKVLYRNKSKFGTEIDIIIPSLSLALEPGSLYFHKNKTKDAKKRKICSNLNYKLITIYFDSDLKKERHFKDVWYIEKFSQMSNYSRIVDIVYEILLNSGINFKFSSEQLRRIALKSQKYLRRN